MFCIFNLPNINKKASLIAKDAQAFRFCPEPPALRSPAKAKVSHIVTGTTVVHANSCNHAMIQIHEIRLVKESVLITPQDLTDCTTELSHSLQLPEPEVVSQRFLMSWKVTRYWLAIFRIIFVPPSLTEKKTKNVYINQIIAASYSSELRLKHSTITKDGVQTSDRLACAASRSTSFICGLAFQVSIAASTCLRKKLGLYTTHQNPDWSQCQK